MDVSGIIPCGLLPLGGEEDSGTPDPLKGAIWPNQRNALVERN
jgi:hypothetical protein